MIYRTYDGWNLLGFYVLKGSKSRKRNELGIPVFGEDQVEPRGKRPLMTITDDIEPAVKGPPTYKTLCKG